MRHLAYALVLSASLIGVAGAVECKKLSMSGITSTVCRIDIRREELLLLLNGPDGKPLHNFGAIDRWLRTQHQTLTFAMNAGMFHPDYRPVGLFIAAGKQESPLNRKIGKGNFFMQPNGVFALTDQGTMIVTTDEYAALKLVTKVATQSGPLLVHNGKINTAFQPHSTSRYLRNGVCAPSPNEAAFVISDAPVNFYEFSLVFKTALKCNDALYLDGSVSGLFSTQLQRNDATVKLGPIFAVAAKTDGSH